MALVYRNERLKILQNHRNLVSLSLALLDSTQHSFSETLRQRQDWETSDSDFNYRRVINTAYWKFIYRRLNLS